MRVDLGLTKRVICILVLSCTIGSICFVPLEAKEVEPQDQAIKQRDARSVQQEQKSTLGGDLFDSLSNRLRIAYNSLIESSAITKFGSKSNNKDDDIMDSPDKTSGQTQLSPVILVPGYGGSRLEARWDKGQVEHFVCESKSDWANIWLDVKRLLPYMIDCLIELFRLEFDPKTNTTHNTEGVEVRVKDPDDLSTVEYLNNLHAQSFGYFALIIKRLTNSLGYQRDVNLRGAPYDFRKAPNELGDYFKNLKFMSEQLLKQTNGQEPVTYICHSMGCNNILYFLQRQSRSWKAKHVKRVISLAAPWAGSMAALRAVALGDNLGLTYLLNEATLNKAQRSLPSTVYLFPHKDVFAEVPLVRSHVNGPATKTFTTHNYEDFFASLQHPNGFNMWLQTKDLLNNLNAPQVEVYCFYGENIKTIGRFEFYGDFPNSTHEVLYDNGDGTVTVQSSAYCKNWAGKQKQPVYTKGYNINHVEMLRQDEVLDDIEKILAPEPELEA